MSNEQLLMERVVPVALSLARWFWDLTSRRLDLEELRGECVVVALEGVRQWDPARGAGVKGFVAVKVRRWLIASARSPLWQARMGKRLPREWDEDGNPVLPDYCPDRPRFDLESFRENLSERARLAVDAGMEAAERRARPGCLGIKTMMAKKFRWELEVIQEVLGEIREALG